MNTPLQLGITGGIGSGKSTVARIFSCLGISVYDADSRAKAVMTTDGIVISRIKKEFGGLSYHKDGSLNRPFLASEVFNHPERLELLNSIVHPRVQEDYKQWIAEHRNEKYVVKEAALLYEAGSYQWLDYIVVVVAPAELRVKRVMSRDKERNEQQIRAIMDKQWSDDEKTKRADFVVYNDETQLLIPQVLALHTRLSAG